MRTIPFVVIIVFALLFDIWFSEGLPWATFGVIIIRAVYGVLRPFLRI